MQSAASKLAPVGGRRLGDSLGVSRGGRLVALCWSFVSCFGSCCHNSTCCLFDATHTHTWTSCLSQHHLCLMHILLCVRLGPGSLGVYMRTTNPAQRLVRVCVCVCLCSKVVVDSGACPHFKAAVHAAGNCKCCCFLPPPFGPSAVAAIATFNVIQRRHRVKERE